MSAATDNIGVAKRAMNQKAVLWAVSDLDAYGQPVYDDPVEIDCRWEDVQEEFIDANGDRVISRSRLIVDRDIDVKSKMKLEELDSNTVDDPNDDQDAWEVKQFMKTPNFKGTKYLREVYL